MTKPQLVKVEALFYVLQQVIKRDCAYFDTAPCCLSENGLFECVLNCVVRNHFFFEDIGAGLGGLNHFDDLAVCTAFTILQGGHCFLCHILGGLGAYR